MIAEQSIPIYRTLADVFGSVEASLPHAKRWNELAEQFELRFGRKPTYIARAPGRVKCDLICFLWHICTKLTLYHSLIGMS